jgi:putative addiction module component (TIGR02574 family)
MTMFDIESLSPQERLDLIGRLWDSLDTGDVQLTAEQAVELDRRLETLEKDIKDGRDAGDVLAELRRRYPSSLVNWHRNLSNWHRNLSIEFRNWHRN